MSYALRFHRVAVPKPWAGNALATLFPDGASDWPAGTGESIEVADLPGESTRIANGIWRDLTLGQAMAQDRLALLGQLAGADDLPDFPLAIKLLDTRQPLSIQDHPRDKFHKGRRIHRGKSEGWLVLKAEPGAVIYQGLKPGLKRADFEDALRNNRADQAMNARPVAAGDWLYNPAGMVHAIGGGLALLEIQQNAGVTWRLWDFPRPGGLRRDLHLKEGLAAADFETAPPQMIKAADGTLLHDAGPFGVKSLHLSQPRQLARSWAGFTLVTCLQGRCEVTLRGSDRLEPAVLSAPDTILAPAAFTNFEIYPQGECRLILSWARAS